MKKILLIISIISVLLLAGCNTKPNVNNDVLENSDNQNQEEIVNNSEAHDDNMSNENMVQSGENISQNKELTEEELIEKYKLSDDYILEYDNIDNSFYNVLNREIYEGESSTTDIEFTSDGVTHKIEYEKIVNDASVSNSDKYNVYINGKLIETNAAFRSYLGIIDLDESDNYTEVVVLDIHGIDSDTHIYRVTKNGLELIKSFYESPVKINGKYIIPNYNRHVEESLIEGYYMYEEGEFKFIDRFLTGEKIKDEEGNYPKNFQNQIFTARYPDTSYFFAPYNNSLAGIKGKVKILKQKENNEGKYPQNEGIYYNIELVEDTTIRDFSGSDEVKDVFLPKGTILEDM